MHNPGARRAAGANARVFGYLTWGGYAGANAYAYAARRGDSFRWP